MTEGRLDVIKPLLFNSQRARQKILAVILRIQKAKVCYRGYRLMFSWNAFPKKYS